MSGFAVDFGKNFVLAGSRENDFAGASAGVQRVTDIGMQQTGIQIFRAGAALLLTDGEDYLDIAVGQVLLFQTAQGFQNGDHASLVVAA